jgi:hypothetical protein
MRQPGASEETLERFAVSGIVYAAKAEPGQTIDHCRGRASGLSPYD